MKKLLLFLLPMTVLLFSCHKDDADKPAEETPSDAISISKAKLNLNTEEQTVTVKITTEVDWEASNIPDWIVIDPTKGSGNADVDVTVEENTGTDSRSDEITFATSTDEVTLKVTQSATDVVPTLALSDSTVEATDYKEFTQTITVETDSSWEVTDLPDWITVNPANGEGQKDITVTVEENTDSENRTGEFKISTSFDEIKVDVSQPGAPVLALSDSTIEATADAADYTLTVETDSSWEVTDLPSWVSVDPEDGEGQKEITISVEENTDTEDRTGEFKISTSFDEITVTVNQEGATTAAPTGTISSTHQDFGTNVGDTKTVTVTTTGTWSVTNIPDWVNVSTTSGTGDGSFEVTLNSANMPKGYYGYTDSLKVEFEGNTVTDTISGDPGQNNAYLPTNGSWSATADSYKNEGDQDYNDGYHVADQGIVEKVIDQDARTYWSSDWGNEDGVTAELPDTITIDMGAALDVSTFYVVQRENTENNLNSNINSVHIETSTDGTTWTALTNSPFSLNRDGGVGGTTQDNGTPIKTFDEAAQAIHLSSSQNFQYFRLIITINDASGTSGNVWPALADVWVDNH